MPPALRYLVLAAWLSAAIDNPAQGAPLTPKAPSLRTSEKPARNDQYGDLLPEHALARMGTLRFRHSGPVGCVAYAPDGRLLASAAGMDDGTLRLWDVATGKERGRFPGPPHTVGAWCILFSGGRQTLAFQTKDRAVVIWDVTRRKELRRLPAGWSVTAATARGWARGGRISGFSTR